MIGVSNDLTHTQFVTSAPDGIRFPYGFQKWLYTPKMDAL